MRKDGGGAWIGCGGLSSVPSEHSSALRIRKRRFNLTQNASFSLKGEPPFLGDIVMPSLYGTSRGAIDGLHRLDAAPAVALD
jgi:hypothetical protein